MSFFQFEMTDIDVKLPWYKIYGNTAQSERKMNSFYLKASIAENKEHKSTICVTFCFSPPYGKILRLNIKEVFKFWCLKLSKEEFVCRLGAPCRCVLLAWKVKMMERSKKITWLSKLAAWRLDGNDDAHSLLYSN